MVVSGKLIMDFYEEYKNELENKQLADWFKFAISNHGHCYAYKAKTFYCNINNPKDLKYIYSLEYKKTEDSIIGRFRNIAMQFPERTAVVCDEEEITYQKLDELSNNIALNLIKWDFRPGDCAAIMCGRSIEHVTTFLGILKVGGYYLPIDENLPQKRIEYMLEKADTKMLIGKSCFTQGVNVGVELVEYDELVKKPYGNMGIGKSSNSGIEFGENIEGAVKLSTSLDSDIESSRHEESNSYLQDYDGEMAYILFTSGSTGMPKGVVIRRSSVVNIVIAMKELVFDKCVEKNDHLRVGVCASFSFDISVQQMYTSLLYGHTLYLVPASAKTRPEQLIRYLNQVDVCDVTPLIMSLVSK
jgi:non-ribosomal peptide synthetase component F